jgi:hypothetical protein
LQYRQVGGKGRFRDVVPSRAYVGESVGPKLPA